MKEKKMREVNKQGRNLKITYFSFLVIALQESEGERRIKW
jgi:hypothetical protein